MQFTQSGRYPLTCRVSDHVFAGMQSTYEVTGRKGYFIPAGSTERKYYIQAGKRACNVRLQ